MTDIDVSFSPKVFIKRALLAGKSCWNKVDMRSIFMGIYCE